MPAPPPVIVDLKLRARYMLAGAVMLVLWGASLVALFRNVDSIHILMTAGATITVLPLGVIALLGALWGTEANMRRARTALFAAGCLVFLIVLVEVIRRIVFGAGA